MSSPTIPSQRTDTYAPAIQASPTSQPIVVPSLTVEPSPVATFSSAISLENAKQIKLLRQLGPSPLTATGIGGAVSSPDSRWLAIFWQYADQVEVWDAASGEIIRTIVTGPYTDNRHGVSDVAIGRDSQLIATTGHKLTQVWDAHSGTLVKTLPGSGALTFSADSQWLAAVEEVNGVTLWNTITEQESTISREQLLALSPDAPDGRVIFATLLAAFNPAKPMSLVLATEKNLVVWDVQ